MNPSLCIDHQGCDCSILAGFSWWKPLNALIGTGVVKPDVLNQDYSYLQRGSVIRTYRMVSNTNRPRARIGVMKYVNEQALGFLGKAAGGTTTNPYSTYSDWQFKSCNSIRTCTPQPFKMYGYSISKRRILREGATQIVGEEMPMTDPFRCGGFGYTKSGGINTCTLDLSIAPLYRVLCFSSASRRAILTACGETIISPTEQDFINQFCLPFTGVGGASTCNNQKYVFNRRNFTSFPADGFRPEWFAGVELDRLGIPCLLNKLASGIFRPVRSFSTSSSVRATAAEYLRSMTCAQTIQSQILQVSDGVPQYTFPTDLDNPDSPVKTVMGGMSLYHFSQFAIYEYPFSWLVKCSMLVGRMPADGPVQCPEWDTSFDAPGGDAQNKMLTWDFLTRYVSCNHSTL